MRPHVLTYDLLTYSLTHLPTYVLYSRTDLLVLVSHALLLRRTLLSLAYLGAAHYLLVATYLLWPT